MPTPAENTLETKKKSIVDQRFRSERQRKLIAELKRDAHPRFVAKAAQNLTEMEKKLAEMEAAAQETLPLATVADFERGTTWS
jgi:hypothetical protein